ncbi:Thiamine phosphate synthase/TenI, partial [Sesbania bispinosa]
MTRYIFLIREKSVLLGDMPLKSGSDIRTAAKLIHDLGPRNVLVKGGDLPNSLDATDIFFDDEEFYELCSSRVNTRNTHGTGYTLASCIAAELAKGSLMLSAVKIAKRYVEAALEYNRDLIIGNGSQGPFDHLLALKNMNQSSCGHDRFNPNVLLLYVVTDSGKRKLRHEILSMLPKCAFFYGVPLLINDRIDVALACDVGGVHVGNKLSVQEFMILPDGASSSKEAMNMGIKVFNHLRKVALVPDAEL